MLKRRRIIWMVVGVIIVIFGIVGGKQYMEHKTAREKNDELIRHAFQLLEEQIAIYLTENYTGISKVEFSPIFYGGGNGSMVTIDVVPVVYDKEGNRALLNSSGLLDGVEFDFNGDGEHWIELVVEPNKSVEVSKYGHLPNFAKITSRISLDDNLEGLLKEGKLKNIKKNKIGSPDAKITYNLEIKDGKYWKWR